MKSDENLDSCTSLLALCVDGRTDVFLLFVLCEEVMTSTNNETEETKVNNNNNDNDNNNNTKNNKSASFWIPNHLKSNFWTKYSPRVKVLDQRVVRNPNFAQQIHIKPAFGQQIRPCNDQPEWGP